MTVLLNEEKNIFTIHTKHSTYQMAVGSYGQLLHLYYGKRVAGEAPDLQYLLTFYDRGFSGNPYDAGADRTYSMDALPQEYPCYGTGDYRSTALQVCDAQGVCSCDLRYQSARVLEGKYGLPGLPAVHTDGAAQTLEIVLADQVLGLEVTLLYGVLEDSEVITRAARIRNAGRETVSLEKAASCCVDFLYGEFDLIRFHGRHGMERQFERGPLTHAGCVLQSRRGVSSHQMNPFFLLADRRTQEEYGECYGFTLLYSGNFKGEASLDQYRQTRALLGISDELFSWELQPGEVFCTPEAALCYSGEGFAALSQEFHSLIRHHVCRGEWQTKRRPVLINSWEAAYFNFDGEKLIGIAEQAAELGVEMLVLDDGWFGKRDSDFSGLGDWTVNESKLGCTLAEITERVNRLGMRFGLWIEPEMVSEDSELYREHPDWAFRIPGREPVRARHQLVLDFSRKEVVDYILGQISDVLSRAHVDYIKMDMNRHLSDIYTAGTSRQHRQNDGATMHRYVLGVYDFLERLLQRFPGLLIEGCAGGGGRFDAGMLYYTPQIWCSDNTDAVERLRIQYGTSFGYPISAVGAHVSAVPNHQTGRTTDLATRGVVAMAGTFGYEMDLNLITDADKEQVRRQIRNYIRFYGLIQDGKYWRLTSPMEHEEYAAWEFSAADGSEALLNVVTLGAHCNPATEYVRLRGLDPEGMYRIEETEGTRREEKQGDSGNRVVTEPRRLYSGSALMYAGLPIPRMPGEYQAWQVYICRQAEPYFS